MIELLDCTLRDGGYINDWNFGKNKISGICSCLVEAGLDIIEVGFLTDLSHTEDLSLYSNCEEIRAACPDKKNSLLAAMIALGEKEMNPQTLPPADESILDVIRITFHRNEEEIGRAFSYAEQLMAKNYKVCMQPVGTTSYTDKQLIELIEKINVLKPYAFYLVDTLGILCKEELLRFIYLIDYNLVAGIKIGFHSHNNLQMSFANAQQLIEYHSKRDFLIDCSIYGMGRGAGNLCTELITQYMNSVGMSKYKMVSILESLDNYVYPIFAVMPWGYSPHYYIAATHRCHPNYASYLINKQTLTMNQVDHLLKNIPIEERYIFNNELIQKLYYSFQNKPVNDREAINLLAEEFSGKEILVLAPGYSIHKRVDEIKRYIEDFKPVVISINGCYSGYISDYIFISNQKRLYELDTEDINSKLILTSNLSYAGSNACYVDYSGLCGTFCSEADNSGLMILRLLKQLGMTTVTIAGYDGFDEDVKMNYCSSEWINSATTENVKNKNKVISAQLKEIMKTLDIKFLTPSKYLEM